ncbi:hypothetical protein ACFWNK_33675 [Streptomyces sp. NPDC058417]|uniref:hypothetical protein n=1 Tax=unclassified Streptomyces TaxID=2593676 RepID=UPI0036600764
MVDELGRMRADFRDVRNRLTASGDALSGEVREVVAARAASCARCAAHSPTSPPPKRPPLRPFRSAPPRAARPSRTRLPSRRTPAPAAADSWPDLPDAPDERHPEFPAIPAQRAAEPEIPSGPLQLDDQIREAVRYALEEHLTPLLAQVTAPGPVPRADDETLHARLREGVQEIQEQISGALHEARADLVSLHQEIADLRTVVREHLQPTGTSRTADEEASRQHSKLLRSAARVSSAGLLCHRDIWEIITAHAAQHPHFRVPPQIAVLISLHAIEYGHDGVNGDRELAATLYERIKNSLSGLTPAGEPVTITLDDRTTPDGPAPSSGGHDDEVA